VPPGIGLDQYRKILGFLERAVQEGRMTERFIDLGFPLPPKPQEYLAAALWLSQKSEADPFKGVLKIVVIQEQVESRLSKPMLCDQVKAAVLSAREEDLPVDPYVMTIQRVRDYSRGQFHHRALDLLRMSIFFKIRGAFYASRSAPDSPKARFIQDLIQDWGWDEAQVEHLKNYASWPERDKLALGQELKTLLFTLYSHIAQKLMDEYPDEVSALDQNLAGLKAWILSRYSDHEAKVEDLPSTQHRDILPKTFSLIYNLGRWELYSGWVEAWQVGTDQTQGRMIYECSRAARVGAWLVHNRLWNASIKLRLRPRPGPVSLETMVGLLEQLTSFFPPREVEASKGEGGRQAGRKGPRVLVVNLEEAWHERRIESVDLIYRAPWGEMRHTSLMLTGHDNEIGKYLAMAEMVLESGEVSVEDVHLFVPEGLFGQKIKRNMRAVFTQVSSGQRRGLLEPGRQEGKTWLDTD
jgi:adenylate cyclase